MECKKNPVIWKVLLIIMLVLTTFLCSACSNETAATEPASDVISPYVEDEVEESVETLPPVQVEMPEYVISYSGELANVIKVQEEKESGDLVFTVKLEGREEHIFTLRFNIAEGELVTILTDEAGEKIPVSFEMAKIPEDLNDDDKIIFYTAQDAVNEIIASIQLN